MSGSVLNPGVREVVLVGARGVDVATSQVVTGNSGTWTSDPIVSPSDQLIVHVLWNAAPTSGWFVEIEYLSEGGIVLGNAQRVIASRVIYERTRVQLRSSRFRIKVTNVHTSDRTLQPLTLSRFSGVSAVVRNELVFERTFSVNATTTVTTDVVHGGTTIWPDVSDFVQVYWSIETAAHSVGYVLGARFGLGFLSGTDPMQTTDTFTVMESNNERHASPWFDVKGQRIAVATLTNNDAVERTYTYRILGVR